MSITQAPGGPKVLTPTQSHWFSPTLSRDGTGFIALVPYTTQYGSGTPPWTVTLTTIAVDGSGNAGAPVPIATYATGFDFQTAAAAMPNNQTAVFWTAANGTYPASHLVDLDVRMVDASGRPASQSVTLLSGINNLEQFRVGSDATGGAPTLVAYSTYDAATHHEEVRLAGFNPDGSAVAADSRLLDSFTSDGYDAFGFGTLTPSTGTTPGFVYLRDVLDGSTTNLAYATLSTTGAPTSALTPIALSYDAGSTDQTLVNWVWDRLDGPAGGNNLVTAAIIKDTPGVGGGLGEALDVRVLNTKGGPAADDVIPLGLPSRDLAITRTAGGGFVIAYEDGGVTWLRQYNNTGDLLGTRSVFPPDNPETPALSTLADGRLVAAFKASDGSTIDEDVFTLGTGPVSYRVDAGMTRVIAMGSGDNLTVKSGGTVATLTAAAGAQGINVLSGGFIKAAVLGGGSEQVFGGATVNHTTLNGADQSVITGGVANATIVNAGSTQDVSGVNNNGTVNAGGGQIINGGGRDYGSRLNGGGFQLVSGSATGTTIAGGDQSISGLGQARQAVITGGEQDVILGGSAIGTTVNGGKQYVGTEGVVSRTVVNAGGMMQVDSGGAAYAVTANAGGVVQLKGSGRLAASGDTVLTLNGGTLTTGGTAAALVQVGIVASGSGSTVEAANGTLELGGTVTGPLALKADAGSTLILDHGAGAGAAFSFAGAATLQLNDIPSFSGSIAHLGAGDLLDLRPIADAAGHPPTLAYAAGAGGGTLSVAGGAQTAKLALVGSYTQAGFHLASDSHGGTLVSYG